jgi:anti-sigma factor RsiW
VLERGQCRDDAAKLAISSYLDGEADAEERALAEYHLPYCLDCQEMALNWRQEARLVSSTGFSDSPAYQIQGEVRANLQPLLMKEAARSRSRPLPALAFSGGMAALVVVVLCAMALSRFSFGGSTGFDPATASAMTVSAQNSATARTANTVVFSPMNSILPATPTVAATLTAPAGLRDILKNASAVRYYPAPAGRFSGLIAVVAWFADKSNRLWIIDPVQGESEVSLAELAEPNEAVRFYNDPQTVMWSERGVLVSYHISDAKAADWGLVVPQAGEISAIRLVQPPTAVAIARATLSPVSRP